MVTKVYMICTAYESGMGHGLKKSGKCNPYATGTDEHEAWGIGYEEGLDRSAEKNACEKCLVIHAPGQNTLCDQ